MTDKSTESAGTGQPEDGSGGGAPSGFHALSGDPRRSALRTYRSLVLANPGLFAWFRYETLIFTLANLPGVVGLAARQWLYPFLFRRCGRKAVFGSGLALRQPDRVSIGARSVIDDLVSISVRGGGDAGIELGERVFVGRASALSTRGGRMVVEPDVSIGSFCRLSASGGELRIGRHGLIAAYCYIGGGGHRFDRTDVPMALQGNVHKGGVTVEEDCWIGAGTIIMDGARIGRGSIIGAGSLVNGEIPPYSIAYGRPARVQRTRAPGEPVPAGDGLSA